MRIGILWPDYIKLPSPDQIATSVYSGTHPLHAVVGVDGLHFPADAGALDAYDVLLVNLFEGNTIVTDVRPHTNAKLVVIPDGSPERFLARDETGWVSEMVAADGIATPECATQALYGALTGKPTFHLPTAITAEPAFQYARAQAKEDYLFASYHWQGSETTLAALLAIQRATGLGIRVVGSYPRQRELVARARGRVEFLAVQQTNQYIVTAARARLAVDLYNAHTVGRTESVIAYAGTPVIGSAATDAPVSIKVDPFDVYGAVETALSLLNNPDEYKTVRETDIQRVRAIHGEDAVRARWRAFVGELEGLP